MKKRYVTEQQAKAVATQWNGIVYKCTSGKGYHVKSKRQGTRK